MGEAYNDHTRCNTDFEFSPYHGGRTNDHQVLNGASNGPDCSTARVQHCHQDVSSLLNWAAMFGLLNDYASVGLCTFSCVSVCLHSMLGADIQEDVLASIA